MSIDDWIIAVTSWGISPDIVQQFTNQQVPGNLYYEIANRQEQVAKAAEVQLYDTTHLTETESTYYNSHELGFESQVVAVLKNRETQKANIIVLDKSPFYPTSGGQAHDTGFLVVGGQERRVLNVEKVGKCVFHFVEGEVGQELVGQMVAGRVDEDRRDQLKSHHTATHIVFASCRKVLGPHIWQAGAKKTTQQVDIFQELFNFIGSFGYHTLFEFDKRTRIGY